MRINEVKNELIEKYQWEKTRSWAQALLGEPGIGKSEGVRQTCETLADMMDLEMVEYNGSNGKEILNTDEEQFVFMNLPVIAHLTEDFTGIPEKMEDYDLSKYIPNEWAKVLSENPGVLFLDDFLDVQMRSKMSLAYRIVLNRRIGYTDIHDGVMVVIASNTPESSSLSQLMPNPLRNRMEIIEVSSPKKKEWARYMNRVHGNDWDKRTLAFLKRWESEGYLMKAPEETEGVKNFPTPRTWEQTALRINQTENQEVLNGLLGPAVGSQLKSFLNSNVDLDDVLDSPERWNDLNLDQKYMLANQLSSYLSDPENFSGKTVNLLDIMWDDSRQYPTTVIISMDKDSMEKLFENLSEVDEKYLDMISGLVRDRNRL